MERTYVVEKVREFNRYYMSVLSLLDKSYLDSQFSATEARILYELRENEGCTANRLIGLLGMDKGYLSRILRRFRERGLLTSTPDRGDTRRYRLDLTEKGRETVGELVERSNGQIGGVLEGLSDGELEELCRAMDRITAILRKEEETCR